jgi:hypothetical protein
MRASAHFWLEKAMELQAMEQKIPIGGPTD